MEQPKNIFNPNILFLDIETVSAQPDFGSVPERLKPLWLNKAKYIFPEGHDLESGYFERAAIYAEFAKVIVIGLGFLYENEQKELCFKTKTIHGHNEREILIAFSELLHSKFKSKNLQLCAHNGKEFDFPFLCRRYIANQLPLPKVLNISGFKPWEVPHLDTMEMWRFGDKKAYTSLELLAATLDVPTSKGDIDGSKVNTAYYLEKNLDAIAEYCQRDVAVLAQIYQRLTGGTLPINQTVV